MTFDWWTFALQSVNFLVLIWLLQRFLYRPVADIIARRRKLADEVLRDADEARARAVAAGEDYAKRTADLAAERLRLHDEAREQIAEDRRAMIEDAQREARQLVAEARAGIDRERAAALRGLKLNVADLAADMAGRLLADVAPEVPNEVFIDLARERIGALPKRERGRLERALAGEDAQVTVVTARPLARGDEEKWRKALEEMLGRAVSTRFETEAALIGGAELRLPDAVIRLSWASELERIRARLVRDDEPA